MFETKDSGKRILFTSGMTRDTSEGKIDYTLVLDGPMFERWAALMTRGAVKYDARNWMKASGEAELERFKQSAFRHFIQWMNGDTDEDHGAAVMFNINGAEYVKQALAHSNGGTPQEREVNDCGSVAGGVGSTGSVQGFNQACLTWAPFSSSGRAYGEGYIPLYDTSIVYGGAFGGDLRRNQLQPSGEAGVEGPDVGSQVCACAYCTGSVQGEGNPHRTIGLDTGD